MYFKFREMFYYVCIYICIYVYIVHVKLVIFLVLIYFYIINIFKNGCQNLSVRGDNVCLLLVINNNY